MLLSAKNCAEIFGIWPGSWYRWVKRDPAAPKPVISAPRYTRWSEEDVLAYKELLIKERRTGYMKKKEAA
jgi:predicted DNA-binding transcriptional regulator AlpA